MAYRLFLLFRRAGVLFCAICFTLSFNLQAQPSYSTIPNSSFTFFNYFFTPADGGFRITSASGAQYPLNNGIISSYTSESGDFLLVTSTKFGSKHEKVTLQGVVLSRSTSAPWYFTFSLPFDLPIPLFAVNNRGEVAAYNVAQNVLSVNGSSGWRYFPLGSPSLLAEEMTCRLIGTASGFLLAVANGEAEGETGRLPAEIISFSSDGIESRSALGLDYVNVLGASYGKLLVSGTSGGSGKTMVMSGDLKKIREEGILLIAAGLGGKEIYGITSSRKIVRLGSTGTLTELGSVHSDGIPQYLGASRNTVFFLLRSQFGAAILTTGSGTGFENTEYNAIFNAAHNVALVPDGDKVFVFSKDKTLVFQ